MRTTRKTTAPASPAHEARQRDLRSMLQDRQREMHSVLQRRFRHGPTEAPADGFDETERAEADVQEHIEVALIQMKREALHRIEDALALVDEGDYGYCADCGGEISETRLRALPFAVRCTVCEEACEHNADRERRFGSRQSFPLFRTAQIDS